MSRRLIYSIWEILEIILIAAVTVFLIRSFIVQPFLVSGSSMIDTFIDGDYVLVDELTYRFKNPERGDIIVFRYPLNPKLFYIKRVVGVAGDHILVDKNNVSINGQKLSEAYLSEGVITSGYVNITVEDGYIFAMGDNRSGSYDSRNFGTVPNENLIGLVRIRLLPFSSAKLFERPIYNL